MLTACKLDWSGSGYGKKGAFKDNGANLTVTPLWKHPYNTTTSASSDM